MAIPFADEICVLARNPYDAGQRSLWHLDKLGSLIDCSVSTSVGLGPDLELVYAVPHVASRKSEKHFPHTASSESEFGFFGLDNSSSGVSKSSELPSTSSKLVRISEKTKIKFLNPVSVAVFSLDLSPSMNVVDTSFKAVTTGCHLVDSLVHSLSLALGCLASEPKIVANGTEFRFPAVPELFVTVVVHGVPDCGLFPLVVGELVREDLIPGIIEKVNAEIGKPIRLLSDWLQANFRAEQTSGAFSCSRTRNACTSAVCQANDITVVVRDCLSALSMTCSQLSVSKACVNKSISILTDGVLAHPRKLPYDNVLMHLNFVDVAMHIVQIGGGFAPWSALGYASDPDLLRLLAASTPTGLFLQDHHLDLATQMAGKGLFGPTPSLSANVVWKGGSLKFSSLTASLKSKRACSHMPYKSLSYQSSLLVSLTTAQPPFGLSYMDHIAGTSVSRKMHAIAIQGISQVPSEANDFTVSSIGAGASPILVRRRVQSLDSMNSSGCSDRTESTDEDLPKDTNDFATIQSIRSYLQPEKAKARPYLYKQYKLPGVSAAQLIQIRTREGFLVESCSSTLPNSSSGGTLLPRVGSGMLTRTSSGVSLGQGVLTPPSGDSSRGSAISFSMHWGPVMEILYELTTGGASELDSSTSDINYVSRQLEEILGIKIYLRMPSGDFFLKFKQQLAGPAGHSETYFWQMCRQMDAFVESIFQVDDTLAKLANPTKRPKRMGGPMVRQMSDRRSSTSLDKIAELGASSLDSKVTTMDWEPGVGVIPEILKDVLPRDVATWHRWFTVRTLFVLMDVTGSITTTQRIRHGMFTSLIQAARVGLEEDIRSLCEIEITDSKLFYCKVADWEKVGEVAVNSHTTNALSRSNDTIVARLSGDVRVRTSTDSVTPFCLIDIAASGEHSVVKLNLGFFGMCPKMERAVVETIAKSLTGSAVLLHTPSPIIRELVAGLLTKTNLPIKKRQTPVRPINPMNNLIGMGTGESFYTYSPEPAVVNRFMLHHAWELACPAASVQADLLSQIHDVRIKEGWKCIHENTNSLIYALFTQPTSRTPNQADMQADLPDNIPRLWLPRKTSTTVKDNTPSERDSNIHNLQVDWDKIDGMWPPRTDDNQPPKYIRGMCTCLHVQHVQLRGEKPLLKCQLWADRGQHLGEDDFRAACQALTVLV